MTDGEDAFGILSWRSAGRIPFFVNGNLENVTGKDWPEYWSSWISETRSRMEKQLQKIRSQPLSPTRKISDPAVSILGLALSPDGNWLAFTQGSSRERMGLFICKIKNGDTRRI